MNLRQTYCPNSLFPRIINVVPLHDMHNSAIMDYYYYCCCCCCLKTKSKYISDICQKIQKTKFKSSPFQVSTKHLKGSVRGENYSGKSCHRPLKIPMVNHCKSKSFSKSPYKVCKSCHTDFVSHFPLDLLAKWLVFSLDIYSFDKCNFQMKI